jgi:hypothetical protein
MYMGESVSLDRGGLHAGRQFFLTVRQPTQSLFSHHHERHDATAGTSMPYVEY